MAALKLNCKIKLHFSLSVSFSKINDRWPELLWALEQGNNPAANWREITSSGLISFAMEGGETVGKSTGKFFSYCLV